MHWICVGFTKKGERVYVRQDLREPGIEKDVAYIVTPTPEELDEIRMLPEIIARFPDLELTRMR